MPHADSSYLSSDINTKSDFWNHVYLQLQGLLEGQRNWVSNCANTASLIFNSLLAFESQFGSSERAVNWCGFYLDSELFPFPKISALSANRNDSGSKLLLGPFCGRPACQFINTTVGKARGVCADAYMQGKTILVPNVEVYPGHIACDSETKSEIVCPLLMGTRSIGVLDLDCLALGGFDEDDKVGLEKIAKLVIDSCSW